MTIPGQPSEAVALTPLQRAFLALEQAQARVARLEQASREPIAVIGVGCRVPGGGVDAESFWALMRDGIDAIGPTPADRWDREALFDADPSRVGRISTRSGGFLERIDTFDPTFFGIAPREAQGMDPQQRLLLEVAWEALEHAGQAADRLEGTATGVYIGLCSSDYAYMQLMTHDRGLLDAHFTSGIAHSIMSGRLSYLLGLQGPSLTIDTACSSSLVAVHLACQALRAGEVRMALAGGVNLLLSPELYIALSHARMLAPDGRCKTFDASADGFARGEGCGVVVLKRLSDAMSDGDRVLAVIRGSAVNQDGPSSGLTAPNGPAQEAVVREALTRAGLVPGDVSVIEAHGTGTQLGDPIEVHALREVFGDRDAAHPLWIGSVKTNIGHLEAAAGVTGLIKLILALRHRLIPAHLHFRTPSPHITWDATMRVPVTTTPWASVNGRRIGGVSSFGFSGTNAHVIVEEAPEPAAADIVPASGPWLLTLSARADTALMQLAGRYADALVTCTDADVADVCFTANVGRAHLPHRATVVCRSADELRERLRVLARGEATEAVRTGRIDRDPPVVAFLFTGQGAQYPQMARGLYDAAPVFRAALDRCAELVRTRLDRPLLDVMFPASDAPVHLDETAYTQPALFAVEYALAELWRSWGITPSVVMGHSVGEYVAACIAGVFSLEDALALVAERGRLMQSLPSGGAMAAVLASEDQVIPRLASHPRVSVAAVNGPDQTVISGAAVDVDEICATLAAAGIKSRRLPVSHAFHSPLVEPVLDAFEHAASQVAFARPRLRLVSNVSGRLAGPDELTRASYWRRHIRECVRFGEGLATLADVKPGCIVEIGPHPTLLAFARSVLGDRTPRLVSSLRQGRDDRAEMLEAAATLHLAGAPLNWRAIDGRQAPRIVDLPTYPFQRERCWFTAAPGSGGATAGHATGHPLLGTRLRSSGSEVIFQSAVGIADPAFLHEHRVQGHVVMPATAYLEVIHAVGRQLFPRETITVADVVIREAMLVADGGERRTVQVVATRREGDGLSVAVNSLGETGTSPDDMWQRHVTAFVRCGAEPPPIGTTLDQAKAACTHPLAVDEFYSDFERRGLDFGPMFRSIRRLWRGNGQAIGEIVLAAELVAEVTRYQMHPVLFDGCLQTLAAALGDVGGRLYLPIGVGRCTISAATATRCWSHVVVQETTNGSCRADVNVFDDHGRTIGALQDVQLRSVARDALGRGADRWLDDLLYEITWRAAPSAGTMVPVPDLVAQASAAAGALRASSALDTYDRFQPKLEALCVDYVVEAMSRLGWTPVAGEHVTAEVLGRRLGILDRHRQLFGRLLAILAEAGFLSTSGDGWRVVRPLEGTPTSTQVEQLRGEYPVGVTELDLTARVAGACAEALRGECDPMQLLFPGGSLDTAERLYRDTPTARFYNGLLAEAVAAAVAGRPGGSVIRILEIGAGTGGSTAHVLPVLPTEGIEYTFTDVGPLFVARAQERFGAHPGVRFQTLDLEREPEAQGLTAGTFDIVIASNVIHATANLRRTLGMVHRLLVPGGLLAMLEVTAAQRWFDLTVGFTDGWWAFTDRDLRADYPTLPREAWMTLLSACGFDAVAALPDERSARGALALQSLMLSRAGQGGATASPREWLVFADAGGVGRTVCEGLRVRGDRCTIVRPGSAFAVSGEERTIDVTSPEHYRRLLADMRAAGRDLHGVVHVWGIDGDHSVAADARAIASAQVTGSLSALQLAQALVGDGGAARLWVVTRGAQEADADDRHLHPAQATLWGLGRTLNREHPELRSVCVDLDPAVPGEGAGALLTELGSYSDESQVAWRAGTRRAARLAPVRVQPPPAVADRLADGYRLVPTTRGALDHLELLPDVARAPGPGEVQVAVEATGLNFKDVLNVLGMYPGDPGPLGGECAGRVVLLGDGVTGLEVGDAVLAVGPGCFASHVTTRAELVQRRPDDVTAEEAAAFPIAYLTAEYCLGHLAGVKPGEAVLVHAAAGGVGLAAVRLAQRAGAVVFATAGSPAKRDMLLSMGVSHVFDSRTTDFADEILAVTGGRGVDVVLNSLSGEMIDASFRAIARGGRFVEIGKRGIKSAQWVAALDRQIEYFVVDWGETADRDPALIGGMLARLVGEWRAGALPSLPRHEFALDEAARAFRFMAQARHIGKIVIRHHAPTLPAVRRDGTYLITGGLSGLGFVVARQLAERGAGRLVLVGRRGAPPELGPAIDQIRALGSSVLTEAIDVSDAPAVTALVQRLRFDDGPPLRGIVHSAGVLADAALLQQDAKTFSTVFAPKVVGGWLLHRLTAADPLDFFVLFSSVAAVLGAPGQANHSAANTFLDALARERVLNGLPALSVNWGAWTGVGAAVDRGIAERLEAQGIGTLTPEQGLRALEVLMATRLPQVAVVSVNWPRYIERMRSGTIPPFFREVGARVPVVSPSGAASSARPAKLAEQLATVEPGRRRSIVATFVRERVLQALGLDRSRPIDPRTPLGELGLDSLLAVELRNTLGGALDRSLPASLLFDYPTIDTLTDYLVQDVIRLEPRDVPAVATVVPAGSGLVESIEDLSDEEVERQLAARARVRK